MFWITLWKFMLSLNGIIELSQRFLRSQVTVFRETGSRIRAMFNFKVSAAPLAVLRQYPMTWNAGLWLYCMNFHVKSTAHMSNQNKTIHARRQYDRNLTSFFDIGS